MLEEGIVHLLATDAHGVDRRPPNLGHGRVLAAKRVGDAEAEHLVVTRPKGALMNLDPSSLPDPKTVISSKEMVYKRAKEGGTRNRAFDAIASLLRGASGRR